ncbi:MULTISPECIES: ATP-dependent metallopeptidase FtsH/Yme1/Tma family protein [Clostridium]|jgi:cell division protease FtsH|uniref:ATP-dependent zinc metalloprotease FtsH n=2 Tax=Clostridium TaxID=1485 RepID=A0A151ARX9_9CLOT|nr:MULTISPECIES: ATP-dependent metallopeptidase FtsH/Yme1/Tma family protein [Clostridium]KYH30404.1 ATP-dependent zinc metalloprotease FtsH [Clostridium colicanis DSM 13634]MBE6044379.1 ATP-dependent metallopeptidase FtsH/Yme1/Tma family protein [Clostridium thermopalmarium]PRR76481.1 ATP-dependent zinc metalloprotease FtsH [Clostridium thermopalmarium DSM 5974]PVZ28406.1 cell division protease FtsH [Clostridium thermopalmarium DSM 5974]
MNKMKNKYMFIPMITMLLSILFIIINTVAYKPQGSKSYTEFLEDVKHKRVSTVYYTTSPQIKIRLTDGKIYETDNPRSLDFKETMLKSGVKVSEHGYVSPFEVIPYALLGASAVAIIFMAIKSSKVTSRRMRSVDTLDTAAIENSGFTFENVAGNEEAKESVKDIIDFLKNPEKYSAYGARMPKGIILYGEPGTGKTLLAKAVAGEAGVPFYAMSGSDFVQIYVGVGASRIRQLFKKARSHGKAVIFIDEIDAIGKKRDGSSNGGSDERDQTLNALLTEMSGFNEKEGIIVMAATNRLDMLDPALLRPGRFDRHIEVSLPDVAAREKILKLHLKNKPVNDDISVKEWAQKTSMFSGAKLEHLVNEAAILACKDNSKYIKNIHLDKAFSIVLAGYERQERDHIRELDKKITAYHEAGHALVSAKVLPEEKLSKVTIIPTTNGAGGYTLSIPEDKMYQNKSYLLNRIKVLLGGRAAEEIIFGKEKITTGAYSDLKHSTNLVTNMVTAYGMGESLGLLTLSEIGDLSSSTKDEIIRECKTLIDKLYEDTKNILLSNKNLLEDITNALLEKETLYYEDMEKILH